MRRIHASLSEDIGFVESVRGFGNTRGLVDPSRAMIVKTFPYIAMINQQFHRIYADCEEVFKFLGWPFDGCCTHCLRDATTMLEAKVSRQIYAKPPAKDGVNLDWTLNIEAIVCCQHHHITAEMSREQWIQFAKKCGAKPFFMEDVGKSTAPEYEFDDEGNPVLVGVRSVGRSDGRAAKSRSVSGLEGKKRSQRARGDDAEPAVKMIKCQFCSRPHPIFGRCSVCYG